MTRPFSPAARLLAAVAAAGLAGCVPEDKPTPPTSKAEPAPAKQPAPRPPEPPAVPQAEVFRPPAPTGAADDARVAAAAEAGDAIAKALAVVHQRLTDLKAAYESKAKTEGDLRDVAERMKPLVAAARTDCDAILRAARDLLVELPHAETGYAAAAALYRERAERYRDPALAAVTRRMADEFDRLAADAPRKLALTEAFVARLVETQAFLAETERCLNDTATALRVLSAGRAAPEVSAEGRTFRRRLEEFLAVVADYQSALFPKPVPKTPSVEPAPKQQPPPQPANPEPKQGPPRDSSRLPALDAPPPRPAGPRTALPPGTSSPAPKDKPTDPAALPAKPLRGWEPAQSDLPPPVAHPSPPVRIAYAPPPAPRKQAPYPGSNPTKRPAPYPGSRRR